MFSLLQQVALTGVDHGLFLGGLLHIVVDLLQLLVLVVHLQNSVERVLKMSNER